MSLTAVVLAADAGSGFDIPKYLAPLRGVALLEATLRGAASWPVDEVVVVLGSDAEQVIEGVGLDGVTILIDPDWVEGTASSLRAAIDYTSRDRSVDAVVVLRGDQPDVGAADLERLVEEFADAGASAIVPKFRYSLGWPVVIGRALFDRFLGLEGEIDVHDVIATHAPDVREVWFDHLPPRLYSSADDVEGSRGR